MKKIISIALAILSISGFTILSFAQQVEENTMDYSEKVSSNDTEQDKFELIRGRIVSIDEQNNQIVIEEDQTHLQRTITVNPELTQHLRLDDHVKIRVKPGENKAENIQEIIRHHRPHPHN